jgi:flagellar protein FliT
VSAVKALYQATIELIQLLENPRGEREDKITKIEMFLDHRESRMKEMLPPYTPEEVAIGHELIRLNSKLNKLLQTEKILIQKDIRNLQVKKESNTKYINPYQNVSIDGMFYDKKK